jgi:hypothetical protein
MSLYATTRKPRLFASALAALALVIGAGVFAATPARADHGPDVSFSFSFGVPAPVIPVPVPVVEQRVYYEQPAYYAPPVVYRPAPVYYPARYYYADGPHQHWKHYRKRGHGNHDRRGW